MSKWMITYVVDIYTEYGYFWTPTLKNRHNGFLCVCRGGVSIPPLKDSLKPTKLLDSHSYSTCPELLCLRLPFKQMCSVPWRDSIIPACCCEFYVLSVFIIKSWAHRVYMVSLSKGKKTNKGSIVTTIVDL